MDLNQILTVEEIKFLKEVATELKNQDSLGTASPVFYQIENHKIEVGRDPAYYDQCIIIGDECTAYYDIESLMTVLVEDEDFALDEEEVAAVHDFSSASNLMDEKEIEHTLTGWEEVEELKNAFLTLKAARAYIDSTDPREYRNPRVWASRGVNNPELEQLLTIIGKFASIELPEGDRK